MLGISGGNGGSKCAMASVPSRGGGVVSTLWCPPIPATCETALNFGCLGLHELHGAAIWSTLPKNQMSTNKGACLTQTGSLIGWHLWASTPLGGVNLESLLSLYYKINFLSSTLAHRNLYFFAAPCGRPASSFFLAAPCGPPPITLSILYQKNHQNT